MSIPMSKEEIELTCLYLEQDEEGDPLTNRNRVLPRMVSYILANVDDFLECYNGVEDDEELLYDIHLKQPKHLQDNIQAYFADSKTCYGDLGLARKAFGDTTTTEDEYDQMEKSLGLMYLYCPEDMQDIVHATMLEATQRKIYFEVRWAKDKVVDKG